MMMPGTVSKILIGLLPILSVLNPPGVYICFSRNVHKILFHLLQQNVYRLRLFCITIYNYNQSSFKLWIRRGGEESFNVLNFHILEQIS